MPVSKELLKIVLTEQRFSILKRDTGIEREVLSEIGKKIKLPHVHILTGMRRCGKSTLLRQIIKKYYNDTDFYYVNFDDERFLNFDASDFNLIYETLTALFGKNTVFFIDEIQNVDKFETFVRRFYDQGFKFFITGSNATLLSKELGTRLTGRHIDTVVKPFSFNEFLKKSGYKTDTENLYLTENRVKIKKLFEEYLTRGGMPEYLFFDNDEILHQVYEDIVIKDIVVRHNVDNALLLKQLYQYLISNPGRKFSYNSLSKLPNMVTRSAIMNYIDYLQQSYFGRTITKFDYSYKKQLINDKKFYAIDNGFLSIISTKINPDKGWLLENAVFNQLDKLGDVYYYSGKKECDFILSEKQKPVAAVQVCYEINDDNYERELQGLLAAMDEFNLEKGMVLTFDYESELEKGGRNIIFNPVWKWMVSM